MTTTQRERTATRRRSPEVRRTAAIKTTYRVGVLAVFAAVAIFPVIFALLVSLKRPVDAFTPSFTWIFEPTFEYYKTLWIDRGFSEYLINTLIIALTSVVVSVPTATLAAYGLVRHESRFANGVLNSLLALRMFPQMLLAIPYFMIATATGLFDTHLILILIVVASNQPFAIWLMRGFILGIPKELDEAAAIDGCSMIGTVRRVILPLSMPGIATTSIFTFLLAYNEYLFALVLTGRAAKTLPVAIGEYGAEDLTYWALSAAGVVSVILPVILVMVFLQRWLVRGLTAGAVKG